MRELFKFSCAHMTVFPDGTKERLHGHNYFVGVAIELGDISFANMVPFAPIKEATSALCRSWKEHLLLAEKNPYFEIIGDSGGEFEFRLCGDRYLLPRQDVLLLPIDNVSVESLAAHIAETLVHELGDILGADAVRGLEVRVTESPGQGAVYYRELG